MTNNWSNIWQKRILDTGITSTLQQLIAADGFDSSFGTINGDVWLDSVQHVKQQLGICISHSIFEVGCGAGAFLYPFHQAGNSVSGIDYSPNLIDIAKQHMPNGDFEVSEAIEIDEHKSFDFSLAYGVFLYFPNYDYAKTVLNKMLACSSHGVAILDVPDLEKKEEALTYRRGALSEKEYDERYRGLDHLYYKKNWFLDVVLDESVDIYIEDQNIEGYGNSKFRFNVFIKKRT